METDLDSLTLSLSKISVRSTWIDVDLWPEIFKRLPTKTLGRFRCVCKSWNSLISSPFFVNLHRSFFPSTTPPNLKPYLVVNYTSFALCRPQQDTPDVEHLRHDIQFPFQGRDKKLHLRCIDVVHGVVCVSHSRDSSYDSTVLWNPSIRNYIALPMLPSPFPSPLDLDPTTDDVDDRCRLNCCVIGLGYDSSKNDFKVVRMRVPYSDLIEDSSVSPRYDLYSTQQGVWRTGIVANNMEYAYGEFILGTSISGTSCFVNSTIHWLVFTIDEMFSLLMFDCEREEFRTMELPEEIFTEPTCVDQAIYSCWASELLEYVGMLSIMMHYNWFDYDNRGEMTVVEMTFVELWVMEEHGVDSSWRKLYKIFNNSVFDSYQPSFEELNSYGLKQLAEYRLSRGLSYRVYEENLCLMDDVKAKSYVDEEIVLI